MENQTLSETDKTQKAQQTRNGTLTRPLYIKHFSLGDWELVKGLISRYGFKSAADAVRESVRSFSSK